MARVMLQNVLKRFGSVVAVNDVTLELPDREFTVLVGPSGCGKTTALRLIAGLEEATGGDIYIGERRVNDVPPKDRDIAMVFQNYALYPHMTVYENMAFGLRLRKKPRPEIDRRVKEAAGMLGIGGLLDRKPKQLSGGQRQRVALGRAIVREPQVFLMDEPLSNLDAKLRVQTRAEIKKLHARLQTTTVYVTHDQVEAMTMGERICIMREGKVVQVGPPLEVYRNPADTFVAGFLASPPMNLIEARLTETAGSLALRLGGLDLPVPAADTPAFAAWRDKAVVFGIRPEDIYQDAGAAGRHPVDVTVVAVEVLGPEIVLIAALPDGKEIAARMGRSFAAALGATQRVHFDLDRLHLFDTETRRAIPRAGAR